jgi:hypothetical protein
MILLALLPTNEPVPETTSVLDPGHAWEAALVEACQEGLVAAEVVHRCYDLGDLLGLAATGRAEVALVSADTRWLDREAVARLAAAGLAVVGVAADEDDERRLRQLGLTHLALDSSSPATLVDLARAASQQPTGSAADPLQPPAALDAPGEPVTDLAASERTDRRTVVAVWGPKGAPGRTTVAVNLAFEAAGLGDETLLVDADTYGGTVVQTNIQ